LPDPSHPALQGTRPPIRAKRAVAALRLALGSLLALSLLAIPQVASPQPVAAGASCTGWGSTTRPPEKIRVLRTRTGRVETVDFRQYVARVMASGEWPSRLRMATLEAGALATKQYAWYYTLKGNHRPHYVKGGKCYDVRDDTMDQLYQHYAQPDSRQWTAVDKTWGLTLRKSGRFFLTGYRAGSSSVCGADANGWKLYARSAQACAEQGWSYDRILRKYLNPNLGFVWSDKVGPTVTKPRVLLKVGNRTSTGVATVKWSPVPRKTEVARFRLQRKVEGGVWKDVDLARPKGWKTDAWVKVGSKTRFRVKAKDAKGNWGRWTYGSSRHTSKRGPAGITIAGEIGTASTVEPRPVKTVFTGRSVALHARVGPGMGRVKVILDGKRVATVDLDRAGAPKRQIVWARNWSAKGEHKVVVKPVSADERVDFNGFYILR
jgi:hypothetical protein